MKKWFTILTALIMALALCSSALAETELTFWHTYSEGEEKVFLEQVLPAFEAENPDIRIEYVYVGSGSHQDQLRVKLMGGEGPDVFGISAGAPYNAFRDFEEELSSYCEETWERTGRTNS